MKSFVSPLIPALSLVFALLGSALLGSAQAAPRVWTHQGYTRLVFDLPVARATHQSKVAGQTLTLSLSAALRSEAGALAATGVKSYRVSGKTVTVTLASGYAPRTQMIAGTGSQPARLVVDVLKIVAAPKPAAKPAAAKAPTPQKPGTPSAAVRPASSKSAPRPRVVIDAGHGGRDPGMVSRWLREKDVTLAVALRVRELLEARGVEVILTRTGDYHLSGSKAADLDARSNLASAASVSAFISIHVNASSKPGSQGGVETYYFGRSIDPAKQALAVKENGGGSTGQELTRRAATSAQSALGDILAQTRLSFSQQLANKVHYSLISATGATSRGVHTNSFYVIRDPNTPAILTEIGFGDNSREGPLLATATYREKVSQGIAQGILAFLHMK